MRRLPLLLAVSLLALGAWPYPVVGANRLLVSGYSDASGDLTSAVLSFNATTGKFIGVFASDGGLDNPQGLVYGPDGNLYVASHSTNNVLRYGGTTGAFIDVFASGGGLSGPVGLVFGRDGHLYVTSSAKNEVLRYDGSTGAFMGVFVAAGSGGLNGPTTLVFGRDDPHAGVPRGHLYVVSSHNSRVLSYDSETGAFIRAFGGGLDAPQDIVVGPDGHLYVTSSNNNTVLRFNEITGDLIDTFVYSHEFLSGPVGLVFGPDGHLYVANSNEDWVKRYDGSTGAFIDWFANGGGTGFSYIVFRIRPEEAGAGRPAPSSTEGSPRGEPPDSPTERRRGPF